MDRKGNRMEERRSHRNPLQSSKKKTMFAWVRGTAAETQRGQVRKTSEKTNSEMWG